MKLNLKYYKHSFKKNGNGRNKLNGKYIDIERIFFKQES